MTARKPGPEAAVSVATSGKTLPPHHVCENCKSHMLYRVESVDRVFMFCPAFPECYLALKERRVLNSEAKP